MSKSSTPNKGRRSPFKTKRKYDALLDDDDLSAEISPNGSISKRFRHDSDIDLSGILSEDVVSDREAEIAQLFAEKFQEKSPASRLSSSFQHFGMNESKLLKQPRTSSLGRRTIGLTSEERERKRKVNRSLNFPVAPKSPRRRLPSRSPKK